MRIIIARILEISTALRARIPRIHSVLFVSRGVLGHTSSRKRISLKPTTTVLRQVAFFFSRCREPRTGGLSSRSADGPLGDVSRGSVNWQTPPKGLKGAQRLGDSRGTRRRSRQHATRSLARRCVGDVQPGVSSCPDAGYAAAGANEQRGRRQAHKSKQQCIFDQVLALLITKKLVQRCFHRSTPFTILNFARRDHR